MILSPRLKAISELVIPDQIVFDCGSDHALLPCFLVAQGLAIKAYAADIKEGPLKAAMANIQKYGLADRVIPLLSDGLNNLPKDATVLTIAGMGYHTAVKIMNSPKLQQFKQVIVQTNRKVADLRRYLSGNAYRITAEKIVFDRFFYEIIAFDPHKDETFNLSDVEIKYGPHLLTGKDPTYDAYLNKQSEDLELIYQKHPSDQRYKEIEELKAIIKKRSSH